MSNKKDPYISVRVLGFGYLEPRLRFELRTPSLPWKYWVATGENRFLSLYEMCL